MQHLWTNSWPRFACRVRASAAQGRCKHPGEKTGCEQSIPTRTLVKCWPSPGTGARLCQRGSKMPGWLAPKRAARGVQGGVTWSAGRSNGRSGGRASKPPSERAFQTPLPALAALSGRCTPQASAPASPPRTASAASFPAAQAEEEGLLPASLCSLPARPRRITACPSRCRWGGLRGRRLALPLNGGERGQQGLGQRGQAGAGV